MKKPKSMKAIEKMEHNAKTPAQFDKAAKMEKKMILKKGKKK